MRDHDMRRWVPGRRIGSRRYPVARKVSVARRPVLIPIPKDETSRDVCSISVDRARRGVLRGSADLSARSWEHRSPLGVSGLRRSWRTYVGGCNVTLAVGSHAPIYFGLHAWSASRRRQEKRKKTRARNRPRVYLRGVLSTVALPPRDYDKLDRGEEGISRAAKLLLLTFLNKRWL